MSAMSAGRLLVGTFAITVGVAVYMHSRRRRLYVERNHAWWASLGARRFTSADGRQRLYGFPGWDYIYSLCDAGVRVAIHLNEGPGAPHTHCRYVSAVLLGQPWVRDLISNLASRCQSRLRVQINIHSVGVPPELLENTAACVANLDALVVAFPGVDFILPRPAEGDLPDILRGVLHRVNVQVFHDSSGGLGIEAKHSSAPPTGAAFGRERWVGYTGGISADNVTAQLSCMLPLAGPHKLFSDMQTNVRMPTVHSSSSGASRRHRSYGDVDLPTIRSVCEQLQTFCALRSVDADRFLFSFVGMDESVPVSEFVDISRAHSFVEWALCLAYQGSPACPTAQFAGA